MDFETYQEKALKTAKYPRLGGTYVYPTLGLVGEAGEVAEKIKKITRDNKGIITKTDKKALQKELGDVLWYLAALSKELNINLQDVATTNIKKLQGRQEKNTLQGEGDDR